MKLTIKKDLLLDALNKVSKAISTKNLIPVLAGIKFELKKKKLTLTASDNDITIQSVLPFMKEDKEIISNYTEGSTLISAKYLIEIIRRLDSQLVTLEIIDDVIVQISDNKSHF